MSKGIALFFALAMAWPVAAEAQERKSPLEDAPAIRRRLELRDKRFEIGVGVGSSVGQDFYHAVTVNGRLGFHLTDWLALSGTFGHNLTPKMRTSFHDKLLETLPAMRGPNADRTPTRTEAQAGMNRIAQFIAPQVELVPFTGKFALFGALFMSYDFYAFGGPGFIKFESDGAACAAGANAASCPVTGMKIGANFGAGMHAFFNDWFAVNLELRDILLKNNPSGRDKNGDTVANDLDMDWDSNYLVTFNFMFFLPAKAPVSQ